MNILHVINSLSDGGAEAVLYRLVTNDLSNLHHVISLTNEGKYGSLLRNANITVTTLDMPRGKLTLQGLRKLFITVHSWPADVIQTWMYHSDLLGGVAGRFAGIPVVWGIRNTVLESDKSPLSTLWTARLCAWLSRWVPKQITSCAQTATNVHVALGYYAKHMVVIPNGYDLSLFKPESESRNQLRAEWDIPQHIPLIGMVARFDPYKDHHNLLSALTELKERDIKFRAILVGANITENNNTLAAQIRTAGLTAHIRLLGPTHNIPDIMGALDVHVLSSLSEAFPNVVAEAMACGTPCVTTNVGDAANIVGNTGWVVPPRDSKALASALQIALSNWECPTEWANRQQRCRRQIEQEYSLGKMIARYRKVWIKVARRRSAS